VTGRLATKVVGITRDGDPDDPLAAALEGAGAAVRSWPTLAFTGPDDPAPLDDALRRLDSFDWVAFTSRRAVDAATRRRAQAPEALRVAAVGEATAARVRSAGWPVHVVGAGDGAEGLVSALTAQGSMVGSRVLFPAGSLAGTTLEDGLRAAGAAVERVEAYRTLLRRPDAEEVRRDLARGVHAVVFTSPSAVEGLALALGGDLARELAGCRLVAAGRTTAGALERAGTLDVTVAAAPGPDGLVDACEQALEGR